MPRYKLTLEYDGTRFFGWQYQNGQRSVQGELEAAFAALCGEAVHVAGAGRTDAGVHASAQVAHVDLPRGFEPYQVMMGSNFHLLAAAKARAGGYAVPDVAVVAAEPVGDDFHARFSATRRRYTYRILNRRPMPVLDAMRAWHVAEPLDIGAMREAAAYLLGTHDFTSFRDSQCQAKSPVKTLDTLDIERAGDDILLHLSARSFLHHQVRILAGTLRLAGNGTWTPQNVRDALEAKCRTKGGPTAPAHGLCLTAVEYGG